ncbi:MAG TPA: peptide chain release factor N(5)-glutamine methyltransferase [Acidimicrobiales bacterium]|nr:peptide chain release factor N(5)-glutamine methyltransferase [Acidimicrobiales bacterium]
MRDLLFSVAADVGSAVEARWIVARAAGITASDLLTRLDKEVAPEVSAAVQAMVDRCLAGEPLQYVLGTWSFRTLELSVDRRVLIPRPETEQVVAVALDELSVQSRRLGAAAHLVAVDLGTGSGAIALALASEFGGALGSEPAPSGPFEVWATDVSRGALDVLEENLVALARRRPEAGARVRVGEGPWFDALPATLAGTVALVVSNPPYVSEAEWEGLEPMVRDHEPKTALVPGPTGLEAIEALLRDAVRWLAPGGSLVVELAPGQADEMRQRAAELGYDQTDVRGDLAGRPRTLVARLPVS